MDAKPWMQKLAPAEVRLKRFLHYGSEAPVCVPGDRFYLQSFQLEKLTAIEEMLANCAPGKEGDAVNHILKALMDGYAAYPECLIFALAACACQKSSLLLRTQAYKAVPKVCKHSRDLFLFASFTKKLSAPTSGSGAGWRRALSDWYLSKEPLDLANCVTQTVGAHGYTHRDLFKLLHLKTDDKAKSAILLYVMKGLEAAKSGTDTENPGLQKVLSYLQIVHDVKHQTDPQTCAGLLESHNLTKEFIPSPLYKSVEVWIALVPTMPLRDLLDVLVPLSCNGLLKAGKPLEPHVVDRLADQTAIVESNLHPTEVYCALAHYENHARNTHDIMEKLHKQGKRDKEAKPAPKPNAKIIAALKKLLISTFKLLVPTGMRYLVALDLSSNMQTWKCNGARDIKPAHAAILLALCLLHADREVTVVCFPPLPGAPPEEDLIDDAAMVAAIQRSVAKAFKRKPGETGHPPKTELRPMIPLTLDKELSLEDNIAKILETSCGPVEVCQPVVWAQQTQKPVDVFLVLTDYVTARKREFKEPVEALQEYRQQMNLPNSKFITCALVANTLNVAAPNDVGMLDIVGFNGKIARIIEAFSRGAF